MGVLFTFYMAVNSLKPNLTRRVNLFHRQLKNEPLQDGKLDRLKGLNRAKPIARYKMR